MRISKSRRGSVSFNFVFVLVLLLGLWLRWSFGAGLVPEQSLIIAKSVSWVKCVTQDISHCLGEFSNARSLVGLRSLLVFFPTSLSYFVLGINDFSTALQGLLISVIQAFLYYRIGLTLGGKNSGFIALFLWAINPADVFGTRLLSSEALLVLLSLLTIFLLVRSHSPLSKSGVVASSFIIGLTLLVNPIIGIQLALLVCLWHFSSKFEYSIFWLLLFLTMLGGLWLLPTESSSILTAYIEFFARPESLIWLPILFVSLASYVSAQKLNIKHHILLIWLLTSLPITLAPEICQFLAGQCIAPAFISFPELRPFIFFPSAIFIVAYHIGHKVNSSRIQYGLMLVCAIVAIGSLLISQPPIFLLEDLSYPLFGRSEIIFLLSSISIPFVFVTSFAILFLKKMTAQKAGFVIAPLFLGLIAISSLKIFQENSYATRFQLSAYRYLSNEIQSLDLKLPIVFKTIHDQLIFEYVRQFEVGEQSLRVGPLDLTNVQNAYLILDNKGLTADTWWKIDSFIGKNGVAITLYRSLQESLALELAREKLAADKGRSDKFQLYGFLVNQGQFCQAYNSWMESQVAGSGERFIQIQPKGNCFDETDLVDIINTGVQDFPFNFFALVDGRLEEIDTANFPYHFWTVTNYLPYYEDWRVLYLNTELEPDSFYLFTVQVRTDRPAVLIYLRNKTGDWFVPQNTYPNWITIQGLFSTYGLTKDQLDFLISPVLFGSYQTVHISAFTVEKVHK